MRRLGLFILATQLLFTACKKEEPPPPVPPVIGDGVVTCADASGQDYQVVESVGVTVTDGDGDLLSSQLVATVNGLKMEGMADDDADDVFTWAPPTSWDPPLVCRGKFTIVIEARDASGLSAKATLEVEK